MAFPSEITDLSRLCIHTQTNRPWDLEQCVSAYHRAGIRGISIWRHLLEKTTLQHASSVLQDHDMEVVSLVRGGFFASADKKVRKDAIFGNMQALDEAEQIGTPLLVLVCGADPEQSPDQSREQIREGILEILPVAEKAGIKMAIEPLHPMYAADRSAIITLEQANDVTASIASEYVGVAVDLFHLWWDPHLETEIKRCGSMDKLFAFHICDWKPGMDDMLNDRGIMGEGCINVKQIRGWMESAGFRGYHEVEIFSDRYWAMDQAAYLQIIIQAYLNNT
jgi:sugar phosphate isomerase/epimerase